MITPKSDQPKKKEEQPSKVILAYDQTGKPKRHDGEDAKPSDPPKGNKA